MKSNKHSSINTPDIHERPVIWTVSISRLFDLFRDISLEYDARAEIEPIHLGFEEAAITLRERLKTEHCDAIIAAGSNGAYLKNRLPVPVIIAKASGFDVMHALARARKISPQIGLISYQEASLELDDFCQSFAVQVEQRSYVTEEDARAQIQELKSLGIQVVVGAGLITDLAEEAGLSAVFIYSSNSIRNAFEESLEIAQLRRSEKARILQHPIKHSLRARHQLSDLRGESLQMQELRTHISQFARSPATVLLQGETGTGKELAAQALHNESSRHNAPFVAINCGAIAESLLEAELFGYEEGAFTGAKRGGHAGVFEMADGGTLFLDEIGEMPLLLQSRLLRVLEERQVVRVGGIRPISINVRIISATHCDLEERLQQSVFRRDLYYRLAVLRLQLPPLRERLDDLPSLTMWCLKTAFAALGMRPQQTLTPEILSCTPLLSQYAFPGNVRELRNMMERVALHCHAQPLQAITPALLKQLIPELRMEEKIHFLSPTSFATNAFELADQVANKLENKLDNKLDNKLQSTENHPKLNKLNKLKSDEELMRLMQLYQNSRDLVAQHLNISRTTLWRRLKQMQTKVNS